MPVLDQGTSLADFTLGPVVEGGGTVSETTDASRISPQVTRGLDVGARPAYFLANFATSDTTWIRFHLYMTGLPTTTHGGEWLLIGMTATNIHFYLRGASGGLQFQKLWHNAIQPFGPVFDAPNGGPVQVDIKIEHAAGKITVYYDKTQVAVANAGEAIPLTAKMQFRRVSVGNPAIYSAIIVADEDTRNMIYEGDNPNPLDVQKVVSLSWDIEETKVMAVLFAGTSVTDFKIQSGDPQGYLSSSGRGNTDRVSEVVGTDVYQSGVRHEFGAPIDEFYLSFIMTTGNPTSTVGPRPIRIWNNNGTTELVRLQSSTNVVSLQIWTGSAWTTVVPNFSFSAKTLARFDFYFRRHASAGRARMKCNGVTYFDYTGNTDLSGTAWDSVSIGTFAASGADLSEVIIADENTELMQLVQLIPNGNGADTGWTGDYTTIDEILNGQLQTAYDTDFIEAAAVGLSETFTFSDIGAAYQGYNVAAVVIGCRALVGADPDPDEIQGIARIGGVDYTQLSQKPAPTLSLGPVQMIFPNNPATGLPWTAAEINAAEFGFKSN
jgi:hypothetical protein